MILQGGGVADVAAELWRPCSAVPSNCRARLNAEAIGPSQSAVPVVAGTQALGRLVLTRGAGGSACAGTLRRGDGATAAVQPALAEVANRGRQDLLSGSAADEDEIAARVADLDAELSGDRAIVVCALPRHRVDAEQVASFYAGQRHGLWPDGRVPGPPGPRG